MNDPIVINKVIKNWQINLIVRVLVIPSVNRAPIDLKNRNIVKKIHPTNPPPFPGEEEEEGCFLDCCSLLVFLGPMFSSSI
mgnify:CR=1 FL=1